MLQRTGSKSQKLIYAYYLGDHYRGWSQNRIQPGGETEGTGKEFEWQRLAINEFDFANENLLGFAVENAAATQTSLRVMGNSKMLCSKWTVPLATG